MISWKPQRASGAACHVQVLWNKSLKKFMKLCFLLCVLSPIPARTFIVADNFFLVGPKSFSSRLLIRAPLYSMGVSIEF